MAVHRGTIHRLVDCSFLSPTALFHRRLDFLLQGLVHMNISNGWPPLPGSEPPPVLLQPTYLNSLMLEMRPLKWEPWFNPEDETTTALAWIAFPRLSPNFLSNNLFSPWQGQWENPFMWTWQRRINLDLVVPRLSGKVVGPRYQDQKMSHNSNDNATEEENFQRQKYKHQDQVKNTNINHRDKTKEGEIDNRNIEEVQETINEGQLLNSGKLRTLDSNTSKGSNSGSGNNNRCNKNDDDMLRSSQKSSRKSTDTINNENMVEVAITEVQVMSSSQETPQSFIDTSKFEGHIDGEISGDGTRETIINNIHKIARESGLSPKQGTLEALILGGMGELTMPVFLREVNATVFALNGESCSGPDVFTGVKQGDPLSPTIFIIAAEALTRGLNALNEREDFKGFGVPKWSDPINHLAYADDTILFVSAEKRSMKLMMQVLKKYEVASGQLINLDKSAFYIHEKVTTRIVARIKKITCIRQGNYIHLLSALNPTKGVIRKLQ
ncbi:hypothetical protein KY284_012921 [Solanum tuberosum]|nr:hypothetical protein KY284_012921 [Solanum tuberosum]